VHGYLADNITVLLVQGGGTVCNVDLFLQYKMSEHDRERSVMLSIAAFKSVTKLTSLRAIITGYISTYSMWVHYVNPLFVCPLVCHGVCLIERYDC
jgi:hypothetical protein